LLDSKVTDLFVSSEFIRKQESQVQENIKTSLYEMLWQPLTKTVNSVLSSLILLIQVLF